MADGKARRMWALPNAELTVPQALLMHGGPPDLVPTPCPAYLIEHDKGLVLFDTGCHPAVADDPDIRIAMIPIFDSTGRRRQRGRRTPCPSIQNEKRPA